MIKLKRYTHYSSGDQITEPVTFLNFDRDGAATLIKDIAAQLLNGPNEGCGEYKVERGWLRLAIVHPVTAESKKWKLIHAGSSMPLQESFNSREEAENHARRICGSSNWHSYYSAIPIPVEEEK